MKNENKMYENIKNTLIDTEIKASVKEYTANKIK